MVDLHERRERIIRILMMNGKCTMQQLADSLNVSTRTIKRDIDILGYRYPICTENHRNGGVYISNYGTVIPPKVSRMEIEVIQKIISEAEQTGRCCLDKSEIEVLKELIAAHSDRKRA